MVKPISDDDDEDLDLLKPEKVVEALSRSIDGAGKVKIVYEYVSAHAGNDFQGPVFVRENESLTVEVTDNQGDTVTSQFTGAAMHIIVDLWGRMQQRDKMGNLKG